MLHFFLSLFLKLDSLSSLVRLHWFLSASRYSSYKQVATGTQVVIKEVARSRALRTEVVAGKDNRFRVRARVYTSVRS